MTPDSHEPTRRRVLVFAGAAIAGLAGCSEQGDREETNTSTNTSETQAEQPSSEDESTDDDATREADDETGGQDGSEEADDAERDDSSSDDEEADGSTEGDSSSDEENTDDQEEDESNEENNRQEGAISVIETYVTPFNQVVGGTYTPRSTVTTVDAFAIQLEVPGLETDVTAESDEVNVLLDGQSFDTDQLRIFQEGATSPITAVLPMRQSVAPGEHTARIELEEPVVDLPADQTTASVAVEFTVERPAATLVADRFPITEGAEIVVETNIAPGQDAAGLLQSKSGAEHAFFITTSATVESDGRITFTVNLTRAEEGGDDSSGGVTGLLFVRMTKNSITLIDREITLGGE